MTTSPIPTDGTSGTERARTARAVSLGWVPVEACRLPVADQPMRLAAFESLFADAVTGVERVGAHLLRLALAPDPAFAARTAELAVREADCCGFFTFTLTAAQGTLALEVAVPPERAHVLDGIAAQAEAAKARP
ncbi:hypothetical protein SAMN05216298_3150 [Glycomyces sambucus]|uniref:Arsenate reductase n=1 Tax=Glycomyces sambucus TaxID=380244 RepID=A0A1G9IBS3_9ACTN|nr:hypothetical protein [Glycomyces sambucus]SDL22667.1 hypothetical protein SAMN05216298_3150 [Glycomyces sambucus]